MVKNKESNRKKFLVTKLLLIILIMCTLSGNTAVYADMPTKQSGTGTFKDPYMGRSGKGSIPDYYYGWYSTLGFSMMIKDG